MFKSKLNVGPLHIGIIGLALVGGVGFWYYNSKHKSKIDSHNIAVFKQQENELGDSYDKLGGFNVRDYDGESPAYRMRTKQPNGLINTTTWWENSNTSMAFDLPNRDSQVPLSGYLQTMPAP